MKRRDFLKYTALTAVLNPQKVFCEVLFLAAGRKKVVHPDILSEQPPAVSGDHQLKDYLTKIRNPDTPHPSDIVLTGGEFVLLGSVVDRLERLCNTIGYANFAILGFDDAVRFAANHSTVGAFTRQDLDFLEMIYSRDASDYGFYGARQIVSLTQTIMPRDVEKIPGTGNFLFKGDAINKYRQIKSYLGEDAILTSGIRGLVKQFYLYLHKAMRHNGNLSLASRSLAPPGYSYHATGDFDIGQRGLGGANFSERFTATPVFRKLTERGFVEYRYDKDNMLGVRYEPWHIKLELV